MASVITRDLNANYIRVLSIKRNSGLILSESHDISKYEYVGVPVQ